MKKVIMWGVVPAIMVAAGCVYFVKSKSPEIRKQTEQAVVAKGEISNMVTATGTVEPITQVEVGTQVSGMIDKIYVDYNSEVKKGDVLAELDKVLLQSELASQKSTLQSAKTEYDYQEKNYLRIKLLHEKQLVSDQEYETAFYQYEKAKNAYEKSQSDMVKAERNLGYATIYSPIDGVVLSRAVDEGQTVAASFSTPTLFTIANDLSKMQIVADVDEADIGAVKEGLRVTFSVDAFPNDLFEGEVIQVRQEATVTSNVVTYEVIVNAPNPEMKLKPGLTANITIYTMEKKDVLTLPNKALKFIPTVEMLAEGEQIEPLSEKETGNKVRTVWKKQGTIFKPYRVEIGETNGIMTEIVSGLNEGDKVVTNVVEGKAVVPGEAGQGDNESNPFMPPRPGKNQKR